MSRIKISVRFTILLAVLALSNCGYKGKLTMPEQAESNQTETSQSDDPTDGNSDKGK